VNSDTSLSSNSTISIMELPSLVCESYYGVRMQKHFHKIRLS
jgi:hypothetical protein